MKCPTSVELTLLLFPILKRTALKISAFPNVQTALPYRVTTVCSEFNDCIVNYLCATSSSRGTSPDLKKWHLKIIPFVL